MVCSRCGLEDLTGSLEKRVERGASRVCANCRARPQTKIETKYGTCIPHQGEFDEHDNPIDNYGRLILPGYRKCQASDCMNPEHIISATEIERHDISYRTGIKLTFTEFINKLRKEGWKK